MQSFFYKYDFIGYKLLEVRLLMRKKFNLVLILALVLTILIPISATANVGDIYDISVDVVINDDGSANITEVWDAQMNTNTEIYKPMTNMGEMEILNLQVTDSTGTTYETLPKWNVNGSIEEKKNKAGLNYTDNGVEICWGIGDYDRKTYYVSYTMTNLVQGYTDYDGFNSRFVNSDMNPLPKSTLVNISLANKSLSQDEVGMWAFGYDGDIHLVEGSVLAKTINGLRSSREHMTIMLRFNKGLVNPVVNHGENFSALSSIAFRGSSYSEDDKASTVSKAASIEGETASEGNRDNIIPAIVGVSGAILGILAFLGVIKSISGQITDFSQPKNRKELPKESHVQYNSIIPFDGYIPAMVYAMSSWIPANVSDILNAYLLKWARAGLLRIDGQGPDSKKDDFEIYLSDYPTGIKDEELELYTILKSAERPEGYLNKIALETLIEKDSVVWDGHFENLKRIGKNYFKNSGYIKEDVEMGLFGKEKTVELYTDMGIQAMEKFIGFKRFLKDLPKNYNEGSGDRLFSYDVNSWDEYVVYGALLSGDSEYGVKLGNLNKSYNGESSFGRGFGYGYPGFYPYYLFSSVHNASSNVSSSMSNAGYFGGAGGSASFGGGGGFSGGGGGGGSR